jgi:hypothetical protein
MWEQVATVSGFVTVGSWEGRARMDIGQQGSRYRDGSRARAYGQRKVASVMEQYWEENPNMPIVYCRGH